MAVIARSIFGHHRSVRIPDFALERYFARWEFAVDYLLCASDVEGWPMADLLELADDETAAMWRDLRLGYAESTGHPLLRAEIAELYERIEPDDVLVFAGAEEAIFCLASVMLGPGDHAVVTWPGYQSLYEVGRAAGAEVTLHELREDQRWSLDVERLIDALRPETRLVVVNAPHNPTGMLPTAAEWARLGRRCSATAASICSPTRSTATSSSTRPTASSPGADLFPRGVSLGVMSKSFAMAGLRIGWLATRDRELLDRCARMKDYTTICSAAPSEVLALIGLRARDRVLARSRRIVSDNLAVLDDLFRRRADRLSWIPPRGGSIAFPRLLGRDADRRLRRAPRRGRGRPAPARLAVRPSRQPLPDRVRAGEPAGGRRAARSVPGPGDLVDEDGHVRQAAEKARANRQQSDSRAETRRQRSTRTLAPEDHDDRSEEDHERCLDEREQRHAIGDEALGHERVRLDDGAMAGDHHRERSEVEELRHEQRRKSKAEHAWHGIRHRNELRRQ